MARPGSTEMRGGESGGLALPRHDLGQRLGDLVRLAGVVVTGVRDAEPAPEVDLGQLDAVLVPDVLEQSHDPVRGDLEPRHVEDLGPDVRVDPDDLEPVQLQGPPHGLRRLPAGQRDTELLVLVGGGDELVRVRLDPDGDPDLHPLPLAERLGDVGHPHDLLEGVEHDPPDPGPDGTLDLLRRLVVAVEGDPLGGHPGGEGGGELAPEHTSRLSPSSSSHRTTARDRKAFPA